MFFMGHPCFFFSERKASGSIMVKLDNMLERAEAINAQLARYRTIADLPTKIGKHNRIQGLSSAEFYLPGWVLCRISDVSPSLTGEYLGCSLLPSIIYGKLMKTGKRLVMIIPSFGDKE